MAYLLPLYPILKAGEKINIRLGYGRIHTGDTGAAGWKCVDCHMLHNIESGHGEEDFIENQKLCRDCKIAWVREVGHIDYDDAFERRLGIWSGTAFIVFGICAMLLNESTGRAVWKEGDALYWITNHLETQLHILHYLNPVYNILLILLITVAYLIILTATFIIAFLLCMSPTSTRHWRHMTPPMYALVVGELVYGALLLYVGVLPLDLAFVFGPVYIGFATVVGALLFMRTISDGVVRLD